MSDICYSEPRRLLEDGEWYPQESFFEIPKVSEATCSILGHLSEEEVFNVSQVGPVSNIGEVFGFDALIDKIDLNIDWLEFFTTLGEERRKLFTYYFLESSEVDEDKKKSFLSSLFSYSGDKKKLFYLFGEEEIFFFGEYCLNNSLIKDSYSEELSAYLEYMGVDAVSRFVLSDSFSGAFNEVVIKYLDVSEIKSVLFNKKHIKSFAKILGRGKIIKDLNFSKDFQQELIDYILENHDEIIQVSEDQAMNSQLKGEFKKAMKMLIVNNQEYFFGRLEKLDQNEYRRVVQKTWLQAVTHFISNEESIHWGEEESQKYEVNKTIVKAFIERTIDCIGIEDLHVPRSKNSLYSCVLDYAPKRFNSIDIERVLDGTSRIENCPPEILRKKLFSLDDWIGRVIRRKDIYGLRHTLYHKSVVDEVAKNGTEEECIAFLIKIKGGYYYDTMYKEGDFINLLERIGGGEERSMNFIHKFFEKDEIEGFIGLFSMYYRSFKSLSGCPKLKILLELDDSILKNLVDFIYLSQKNKHINFVIEYEDINTDFVSFIERAFPKYYTKHIYYDDEGAESEETEESQHSFLSRSTAKLEGVFAGENINKVDYFDFSDDKGIPLATKLLHENTHLQGNLEILCRVYHLPYIIDSFRKIGQNFGHYLQQRGEDVVDFSNLLGEDGRFEDKVNFLLSFFHTFHNQDLQINDLLMGVKKLSVLKDVDVNSSYSQLFSHLKILEEYVDDFDAKSLIKIGDSGIVFEEGQEEVYDFFSSYEYSPDEIVFILSHLKNITVKNIIGILPIFREGYTLSDGYDYGSSYKIGEYFDPEKYGHYYEERKKEEALLRSDFHKGFIGRCIDESRIHFLEKGIAALIKKDSQLVGDREGIEGVIDRMFEVMSLTGGYIDENLMDLFVTGIGRRNFDTPDGWEEVIRNTAVLDEFFIDTGISFSNPIFHNAASSRFLKKYIEKPGKYKKLLSGKTKKELKIACSYSDADMDFLLSGKGLKKLGRFPEGLLFGYFVERIARGIDTENDSVSTDNFLGLMSEEMVLCHFDQDTGLGVPGEALPWTKAWFLEDEERKLYLQPKNFKTFQKFGTVIGLGLIEGAKSKEKLNSFYGHIFGIIDQESSRASLLQIAEVFNIMLRKENFELFDELVDNEVNIGGDFKEFIDKNSISDKGRTILTLLIAREIRDSYQIFENKGGEKQVGYESTKAMLLKVYRKLNNYKPLIESYSDLSIKTSIGIEIEVGSDTARGYKAETGGDYKNDITIISEYAGIAEGNDAVHEIATKPTDNPYLLLLEIQLLQDLDFLDLNFSKQDYEKGSRGLHINVGGEKGVRLNADTTFIQNILQISNIGGMNVGDFMSHNGELYYKGKIKEERDERGAAKSTDIEIDMLDGFTSIRSRGGDIDIVFPGGGTEAVEYRSLSIMNSEQFERMILSMFNLNMAVQDNKDGELGKRFQKLKKDIDKIIEWHNVYFIESEAGGRDVNENLGKILNIDRKINHLDFRAAKNGGLTERQEKIREGNKKIKKGLLRALKENDEEIYDKYVDGEITSEDFDRKLTNRKRFVEVIDGDMSYLDSIKLKEGVLSEEITVDLVRTFTKINNLFIKKDSTNALAMYDNTMEDEGIQNEEHYQKDITVFQLVDMYYNENDGETIREFIERKRRKGYNIIQGASERMITQAIQKRILEFNDEVTVINDNAQSVDSSNSDD